MYSNIRDSIAVSVDRRNVYEVFISRAFHDCCGSVGEESPYIVQVGECLLSLEGFGASGFGFNIGISEVLEGVAYVPENFSDFLVLLFGESFGRQRLRIFGVGRIVYSPIYGKGTRVEIMVGIPYSFEPKGI